MGERRIQKIEKILVGGMDRLVLHTGLTNATIFSAGYLIFYGLNAIDLFSPQSDPMEALLMIVCVAFISFLIGCYEGSFKWHRLIRECQKYYEQSGELERASMHFR